MNTIEYGQGAVNNTIGWGQGAKVGSSFSNTKSILLDGVDDFVDCGNDSSLQITGELSISAWFKTTYTGGSQMIVGKDGISGNTKRAYMLFWSAASSTIKFFIFTSGNANEQAVSTSTVTDGNWHHVLGVNDGTNLKIYIDGVLEDTNVGGGGAIQNGSATDFYIGRREGLGAANKSFWNGSIDEVAVWNTDQSANASAIYGTGVPTSLASYSPLSWWRCGDGDSAPTLLDNGSASNNGTMTNFSTFSTDVPT